MLDETSKKKLRRLNITLNYKFFDFYVFMKYYLHIFEKR